VTIPPKRLKRSGPIRSVNFERHEREWGRAYHSLERVQFVKRLPCAVCGVRRSHNSHTENGGKGRKGDYTTIIPLCRTHHDELDNTNGREAFAEKYAIDLAGTAAITEERWQTYCRGEVS
jgi:hypothetical protein